MEAPAQRDRLHARVFLLGCALCLLPLCFLGYGSDNDTFAVLEAGRITWHLHTPVTSRNPGYWTFEAIVYFLSRAGGYVATNLATLGVSLIVLWRFLAIAKRIGVRFPLLMASALLLTPVFVVACTSTDDYVWSLLGLICFLELLLAERLGAAILPAAFAFAVRGSGGLLIAGALAGDAWWGIRSHGPSPKRLAKLFAVGFAAASIGGLPYLESYRTSAHSFAFLHAHAGPPAMWTTPLRLGRFAYKLVDLFGPLATLAVFVGALHGKNREPHHAYRQHAVRVLQGVIAMNGLLFFAYPIETSYLLPLAFCALLLMGTGPLARHRWVAMMFLACVASFNVLDPQLARPNVPGLATGVQFRPFVQAGSTLRDIRARIALRGCDNYFCFFARTHPDGPGLIYDGPKPVR